MKLPFFISLLTVSIFFSCTKEAPITRPIAVSETQETSVEDRGCGTSQLELRVTFTNPIGQKSYLIVYDQDGSTRYVYPWACSNQGCTSLPCLDALDNTFYQTFTVDKCEQIKVQLFEVDPPYACNNGTGNVSIQIKKKGTISPVRSFTLTYAGGTTYPSKCFYIDGSGNIGVAQTCL